MIATCHGKDAVIAPALAALGLAWQPLPPAFDSDAFGTFTRERPRAGTQHDAARAKAAAALALVPGARIAIASEGAFGPDPAFPLAPLGQELVLLIDRATGLELLGQDRSHDTNFAQARVETLSAAQGFAEAIGFPGHGVILMPPAGSGPADKTLVSPEAFEAAVTSALGAWGACWLEADMRAHRNPRRMAAIARAAARLAEAAAARCPGCARPGYVAQPRPGRPCGWCGEPTLELWERVCRCEGCGHATREPIDPDRRADPGACAACNP